MTDSFGRELSHTGRFRKGRKLRFDAMQQRHRSTEARTGRPTEKEKLPEGTFSHEDGDWSGSNPSIRPKRLDSLKVWT